MNRNNDARLRDIESVVFVISIIVTGCIITAIIGVFFPRECTSSSNCINLNECINSQCIDFECKEVLIDGATCSDNSQCNENELCSDCQCISSLDFTNLTATYGNFDELNADVLNADEATFNNITATNGDFHNITINETITLGVDTITWFKGTTHKIGVATETEITLNTRIGQVEFIDIANIASGAFTTFFIFNDLITTNTNLILISLQLTESAVDSNPRVYDYGWEPGAFQVTIINTGNTGTGASGRYVFFFIIYDGDTPY